MLIKSSNLARVGIVALALGILPLTLQAQLVSFTAPTSSTSGQAGAIVHHPNDGTSDLLTASRFLAAMALRRGRRHFVHI